MRRVRLYVDQTSGSCIHFCAFLRFPSAALTLAMAAAANTVAAVPGTILDRMSDQPDAADRIQLLVQSPLRKRAVRKLVPHGSEWEDLPNAGQLSLLFVPIFPCYTARAFAWRLRTARVRFFYFTACAFTRRVRCLCTCLRC